MCETEATGKNGKIDILDLARKLLAKAKDLGITCIHVSALCGHMVLYLFLSILSAARFAVVLYMRFVVTVRLSPSQTDYECRGRQKCCWEKYH